MNYIRNFKGWVASIVVLVVFILIKLFSSNDKEIVYQQSSGEKYTTFYNVQYKYADNLSDSIALLLDKFDYSLSPFNSESLLTAINNNDTTVKADNLLIDVLTISGQVYKATSGAFDPTISPLINAWGFGFKTGTLPTDTEIEKLRKL